MKANVHASLAAMALLTVTPAGHAQEPLSPGELLARYNHWQGRQVTLAAYPSLHMSPAPWTSRLMEFAAEPRAKTPALAVCVSIAPPNDGTIADTVALIVRGTFARRKVAGSDTAPHQIELTDCQVLAVGTPATEGGDPWTDHDTPVRLDVMHEAVFAVIGTTVRVEGFYWGGTWSSTDDRTRHDLQDDAAFLGDRPVGCFQAGRVEAPPAVLANRENTVIEGVVSLTASSRTDRVDLADCQFVHDE